LKAISWHALSRWVLVAFFVFAGLLNVFATAPLLAEYQRWGYPGWFHYATGALELSSAFLQVQRTTHRAGIGLGAAVMAAAFLTLALNHEWGHTVFPLLVLVVLIASRSTKPL
jgi:hypothetical protein